MPQNVNAKRREWEELNSVGTLKVATRVGVLGSRECLRVWAFRSIAARLNYLAADRPDIAFAVKEVARTMSAPKQGCWDRLKRIGRYLLQSPRVVMKFGWQPTPNELTIYTDADWAGDKTHRKSTSGGCLMIGTHVKKTWSKNSEPHRPKFRRE